MALRMLIFVMDIALSGVLIVNVHAVVHIKMQNKNERRASVRNRRKAQSSTRQALTSFENSARVVQLG